MTLSMIDATLGSCWIHTLALLSAPLRLRARISPGISSDPGKSKRPGSFPPGRLMKLLSPET